MWSYRSSLLTKYITLIYMHCMANNAWLTVGSAWWKNKFIKELHSSRLKIGKKNSSLCQLVPYSAQVIQFWVDKGIRLLIFYEIAYLWYKSENCSLCHASDPALPLLELLFARPGEPQLRVTSPRIRLQLHTEYYEDKNWRETWKKEKKKSWEKVEWEGKREKRGEKTWFWYFTIYNQISLYFPI